MHNRVAPPQNASLERKEAIQLGKLKAADALVELISLERSDVCIAPNF